MLHFYGYPSATIDQRDHQQSQVYPSQSLGSWPIQSLTRSYLFSHFCIQPTYIVPPTSLDRDQSALVMSSYASEADVCYLEITGFFIFYFLYFLYSDVSYFVRRPFYNRVAITVHVILSSPLNIFVFWLDGSRISPRERRGVLRSLRLIRLPIDRRLSTPMCSRKPYRFKHVVRELEGGGWRPHSPLCYFLLRVLGW